jgi:flagellar protein FliO/FliZ
MMSMALTLRALASFAIVIGLLIGLVWVLRRGSLGVTGGRTRATIAIETATSLGDRRSLVIVNVEGRRLLLGVAPGAVSLLSELPPPSAPGAVPLAGPR